MSQLFSSGGHSIGVSASPSVLPMNIQCCFPLGLTCLISLQSNGLKSFLQHYNSKASILQCSAFFMVQSSYPHMTIGKKKHMVFWLCGPLSAKWCLYFWKHGLVSSISFICPHKNFTKIMKAFIHSCLILGAMKISFNGWMNKLWYILTMEYHSVLKGNEPWSDLEETSACMLLREKANPKWLHTI